MLLINYFFYIFNAYYCVIWIPALCINFLFFSFLYFPAHLYINICLCVVFPSILRSQFSKMHLICNNMLPWFKITYIQCLVGRLIGLRFLFILVGFPSSYLLVFPFCFLYSVHYRHVSIRFGLFFILHGFVFVFVPHILVFNFVFILNCKSENDQGLSCQ